MKYCPSGDWETCPYAQIVDGEITCTLKHPERDCDDYAYEMGEE